jgi:integrase
MRGSVLKRGPTWSYVLYLGRDDATGKKHQKWVGGFRTKKLAEDALTEALERVRTGSWADPGRQTVSEYLEGWLVSVSPSLRATTASSYRWVIEKWVVPRIGSVRLSALTPARLSALYGDLLANGRTRGKGGALAPRSVAYVHRILTHAFKDAAAWGLLPRNPAAVVVPPKAAGREMKVWTAEQVRGFLASVTDDRLYALWAILLTTGMRRGEVVGLRWEDVDLQRRTLDVSQSHVTVGYAVEKSTPKTAKGRRSVSIDPITAATLKAWRKHQREERLVAGSEWQESGLVFTAPAGGPIHPQTVSGMFKRLAANAGLPAIRLHDARHTAATLALAAGVHPKVVSERLGHANISITMDTYSHVVEGMQEEAAKKMASLVYG